LLDQSQHNRSTEKFADKKKMNNRKINECTYDFSLLSFDDKLILNGIHIMLQHFHQIFKTYFPKFDFDYNYSKRQEILKNSLVDKSKKSSSSSMLLSNVVPLPIPNSSSYPLNLNNKSNLILGNDSSLLPTTTMNNDDPFDFLNASSSSTLSDSTPLLLSMPNGSIKEIPSHFTPNVPFSSIDSTTINNTMPLYSFNDTNTFDFDTTPLNPNTNTTVATNETFLPLLDPFSFQPLNEITQNLYTVTTTTTTDDINNNISLENTSMEALNSYNQTHNSIMDYSSLQDIHTVNPFQYSVNVLPLENTTSKAITDSDQYTLLNTENQPLNTTYLPLTPTLGYRSQPPEINNAILNRRKCSLDYTPGFDTEKVYEEKKASIVITPNVCK